MEPARWAGMARSAEQWAGEQFGGAQLGDIRRTRRLVAMAARAARRPAGKVSVVFDRTEEREGAYDLLESDLAPAAAIAESMFSATAARARGERVVYVSIDFTGLTLSDLARTKGFGPIGSPNRPARGLMVANAFAVARDGVPLGLIDQLYWAREEPEAISQTARVRRNQHRPFSTKQSAYFVRAAENTIRRLAAIDAVPWIVIDREGDNQDILLSLSEMACAFTVRASRNRVLAANDDERHVRESLARERAIGKWEVAVGRSGKRPARVATVEVRAKQVDLKFKTRPGMTSRHLKLYAVSVRESGPVAQRSDALEWMLYTNIPVETADAASQIIEAYRARWRVEEFHRTWKLGECDVESAQLRSIDAVIKWATILAAVATRIERMKYLSRTQPDLPASVELEPIEIEALKIERRDRKKRQKPVLPEMPTLAEATRWIAEMGGWMGEKSSGPPGSITIARGLDRLAIYTHALTVVRAERGRRPRR